jgi:hypothetical protein
VLHFSSMDSSCRAPFRDLEATDDACGASN